MVGQRFYYNDGFYYPLEEQGNAGVLEIKSVADKNDVILEMHVQLASDDDFINVSLTKEAVQNMIDYLKKSLEEK